MLVAPHFLFNTMNAIKVLVRQQQDRAAGKMLERLTDFLNYALLARDAHEVALHRELEHVQLYLAIEQVRFGDRLLLDVTVEPDLADAAVPYMCLQPLVENAIRHGIGRSSAGGVLRISVSGQRADKNRGRRQRPWQRRSLRTKEGVALSNTRSRLLQLYGEAATLSLRRLERGLTVATIMLPYHVLPGSRGAGSSPE